MPRYSHRSRKRRRSRGRFGPLFKLLCLAAVLVALTVGATVFFRVETILVSGCRRYTPEEIIAASGIQLGENLYGMNKVRIDRNIRTTLPYVGELTINRSLPSTIVITVTEWEAVAQVTPPDPERAAAVREELAGGDPEAKPAALAEGPWLISVRGKLLEPAPADSAAIQVAGLSPIAPQAGKMMEVPDSEQLQLSALIGLLEALEQEEMTGRVKSVQLESTHLTVRYLDRFDVKVRLNDDFSYSVRLMDAVISQIEADHGPEAAGSVDLTQEDYGAVYSALK